MELRSILDQMQAAGVAEARINVPLDEDGTLTVRIVIGKMTKADGTVVYDALPTDGRDVSLVIQ